jgi:endonuclease/exonuclease/phosphatase (EEP) superfamily protein YafD
LGFKNIETGDLKILSFNINGSGEYDENKSIINLIKKESPDILFLTENFKPMCDLLHERLHSQYPYDTRGLNHNVIYSKFPLRNPLFFRMINRGTSYLVKCEAEVKGKEVTLYGCHLSSNNYSKDKDYLTPYHVKSMAGIKAYISNFSYASHLREMEADTVIFHCRNAERVVIMGDLNEASGSPAMRKFKSAGYKDAWSVGGFGYGATIHHPLPYRIDHVLYNKGLKLNGIKKIDANGISDHDALVAVFDLE